MRGKGEFLRGVEDLLEKVNFIDEVKAVHLLDRLLPDAMEVARQKRRFAVLEEEKVLVLGDVLGDFYSLRAALLGFDYGAVVMLGNYWDGGARNFAVLYTALKLHSLFPERFLLLGGGRNTRLERRVGAARRFSPPPTPGSADTVQT